MMKPKQNHGKSPSCRREQERSALLEEALARPDVREVMKIYAQWQRQDKGLDSYRAATKEPFQVSATDHANVQ